MALPPAKRRPDPPDSVTRRPDWRDKLHAETPEHKHARLEAKYPPGRALHRKFPCIERPGMSFIEAVRKREKAKQRQEPKSERMFPAHDTDGQGKGLPEDPDIPF